MNTLKISRFVYNQIIDTIGKNSPECGGVLGAYKNGPIIKYFFDENGECTENGYAPNIEEINGVLMRDWRPNGIFMVGIVHSHANGVAVPSCGDISYGIRILQALDTVKEFYLPILVKREESIELSCYKIAHDPEHRFICKKMDYEIYDGK